MMLIIYINFIIEFLREKTGTHKMFWKFSMQEEEEDEKQSVNLQSNEWANYDERLVAVTKKIFDQRSEEIMKVYPQSFLDHILTSQTLTGVKIINAWHIF